MYKKTENNYLFLENFMRFYIVLLGKKLKLYTDHKTPHASFEIPTEFYVGY